MSLQEKHSRLPTSRQEIATKSSAIFNTGCCPAVMLSFEQGCYVWTALPGGKMLKEGGGINSRALLMFDLPMFGIVEIVGPVTITLLFEGSCNFLPL